jgi:uncharacterized pyridoxal phosphate-containing UPF0001 family protein
VPLAYGKRVLFDEVNINFARGNCYGVIGANGAGKSTPLKTLFDNHKHQATAIPKAIGSQLSTLSMGMSGDYQFAIEEGSNMVRIRSLLFGARH